MHRHLGREIAAQPGPIDPVVQLNVLAGIETFVERADPLENRAAIGHRHARGRDESLAGRIHVRIGMMAQPGVAGGGDRPLQQARPGDLQRLRTADGVGAAA